MPSLHILHVFATFNVGGTEVRTCNLINRFKGEFNHTIRVLKSGTAALKFIENTSNVSLNTEPFPVDLIAATMSARKELAAIKPDLVITYSWGAIEWLIANALFRSVPLIHAEDGFTDETPFKQNPKRLLFRRLLFRFADTLVVPAKVLEYVAVKYWWLPPAKITTIPNCVDTNRFLPAQKVLSKKNVVLGIIGTLYPVKNHRRLIDAFAKLNVEQDVELWVIGSGPDEADLKEYVHTCGLKDKVQFLGVRTDTDKLLQSIDIFCLSSDHEQMPLTVLEAMASGLPIVSTDVGDVAEMVSEENKRFIVPVDDGQLYCSALSELVTSGMLRNTIGTSNRLKCEREYAPEKMYSRYSQMFRSKIKTS